MRLNWTRCHYFPPIPLTIAVCDSHGASGPHFQQAFWSLFCSGFAAFFAALCLSWGKKAKAWAWQISVQLMNLQPPALSEPGQEAQAQAQAYSRQRWRLPTGKARGRRAARYFGNGRSGRRCPVIMKTFELICLVLKPCHSMAPLCICLHSLKNTR